MVEHGRIQLSTARILLLLLLAGCTQTPVAMKNCERACFEREYRTYMNQIYGTHDNFVDQLKKVCEIKLEGETCCEFKDIGPQFRKCR